MQVEFVDNPVWADAEHTMINALVKWAHLSEAHPFAACASDCEAHGRELFQRLVAGEFGEVAEYSAPVLPEPSDIHPPTATPSSGDIPQSVL